jgi:predicted dehydrogenase
MSRGIRIAVVGLAFGRVFPRIYMEHPDIEYVGICDSNEKLLQECGDEMRIDRRHNKIQEIIGSEDYDAVHLVTPIATHADLSIKILESGKHCACTIPVGLSLAELEAVISAQKRSKKNYMMMETAVYTHHCFYVKELYESGKMGRIQFMRGAHLQDMENWPDYWRGFPPLKHITHAIAPILWISNTRAVKVHSCGTGYMRDELVKVYDNPFPIEAAIFKLDGERLCAEVTRSMFHTAREYCEIFSVYGEKMSYEWHMENEEGYLFEKGEIVQSKRGTPITTTRIRPPSFEHLLPKGIRRYSLHTDDTDPENPQKTMKTGAGHHGSHPHLVHEFIRCIVEERPSAIDATRASNWTAAGICAHESAMNDGIEVTIPDFG